MARTRKTILNALLACDKAASNALRSSSSAPPEKMKRLNQEESPLDSGTVEAQPSLGADLPQTPIAEQCLVAIEVEGGENVGSKPPPYVDATEVGDLNQPSDHVLELFNA